MLRRLSNAWNGKMGKLEEKTVEVRINKLKKSGFGALKAISRFGEEDRARGQLEE